MEGEGDEGMSRFAGLMDSVVGRQVISAGQTNSILIPHPNSGEVSGVWLEFERGGRSDRISMMEGLNSWNGGVVPAE